MRGDVQIAQAEPTRGIGGGDSLGVDVQLVPHPERLALSAPAAFGRDTAAERVHHRVEVGAHAQPPHRHVIAGVADDGDVVPELAQTEEEPRPADAAGQHGDAHGPILADHR